MLNKKKCVPCQGGIPPLNSEEIELYIKDLDTNWSVIEEKEIRKTYVFDKYMDAIDFVNRIANLAEKEGHHPYIHINFKKVIILLFTHKIGGLHENDFIFASKCDIIFETA